MAINLTEDINHSGGGKIVSVAQSQGSWQSIATKATFDSTFLTDTTTKQNLANGQFFYVLDENQLYKLTVSGFGPFATYTLNSASFGEGIDTGSFLTADDTGSFVLVSQTGSFLLVSQTGSFLTTSSFNDATSSFTLVSDFNDITSSLSTFVVYSASNATTASYIDPTFISASAADAGFGAGGGGSIPDGTISGSQQITDFGFVSSSVDTSLFVLVSETGSFLTAEDTGSFILVSETSSMSVATASYIDPTFISASAAASGFGTGGSSIPNGTISGSQQITDFGFISSSTDISALNTFSGSIQEQVDALIAATGSYLDDTNTILVTQSEPSVEAGGIYFDGNDFYLGL